MQQSVSGLLDFFLLLLVVFLLLRRLLVFHLRLVLAEASRTTSTPLEACLLVFLVYL